MVVMRWLFALLFVLAFPVYLVASDAPNDGVPFVFAGCVLGSAACLGRWWDPKGPGLW